MVSEMKKASKKEKSLKADFIRLDIQRLILTLLLKLQKLRKSACPENLQIFKEKFDISCKLLTKNFIQKKMFVSSKEVIEPFEPIEIVINNLCENVLY